MSQSIAQLFSTYNALSPVSQRAVAAVVGASVADAATRPFHWLYDQTKLQEIVGTADPAFWPESQSPFYSLPTGRRSCYNDQCYAMLSALPSSNKPFQKEALFDSFRKIFSDDGEYGEALRRRKVAYDPAQRLEKRSPIDGPWQQHAVTYLLNILANTSTVTTNVKGDASIDESDGLCCSIPFVARLCVQEHMTQQEHGSGTFAGLFATLFAQQVGEIVELISSSEVSMKHSILAARIMRRVILYGSTEQQQQISKSMLHSWMQEEVARVDDETIRSNCDKLLQLLPSAGALNSPLASTSSSSSSDCCSWIDADYIAAEHSFGKACPFPGALFGSLLAAISCDSYTEAVRRNIVTGGCNCSRSNIIGALLGAAYGIGNEKGVPMEWIERTDKGAEIFALAIERCTGTAVATGATTATDVVSSGAGSGSDGAVKSESSTVP